MGRLLMQDSCWEWTATSTAQLFRGGAQNVGTIYKVTQGGRLTTLHSFEYSDGGNPYDALVQGVDGNFYGTTESYGAYLQGTVFKMTPEGTLTTLHNFGTDSTDGSFPQAPLIQ